MEEQIQGSQSMGDAVAAAMAPEPQAAPQVEPQVQEQQPQQAPQDDNMIPRARFNEVWAQKQALQNQLAAVQQQQQMVQQPQAQPEAPANIETVDDLMSAIDKKLENAYQTRLAPLEQNIQDTNFRNNLESYFSTPEKAALRSEMDSYTAMLSPQEQKFIKDSVSQGRTQWLDNIYYTLQSSKQQQAQQMASQQAQETAPAAQTPTQYRTMGNVEPTLRDKIENAKKGGNWQDVFASMVPPK